MAPGNQSRTMPNRPAAARLGALLVAAALLAGAPDAGFAGSQPIKLLAFGDSLVHGYGLPAGESFPRQLESALKARGYPVEVINAGNSGDTTAAGRARLDWALAEDPDLVLVEFGGNDGLRGIDPGETYRNLDQILARLAAEGLAVLFMGMRAPRNLGEDYVVEFDAVFPRLAEKYGVAFYPFFLEGVVFDPSLNQDDGIHPNAAGVAVLVERIVPVLEPLLRGLAARRDAADG
ncbi:MAG: arylesterase [Rhodospirillales bacterium]|nr:arylesterase [Rhodospirillales bacterium]